MSFRFLYPLLDRAGLSFLLQDDFITADAAPISTPRTAEPGPGTLVITDTGDNADIAGEALVFSGAAGNGDPGAWGSALSRASGLAIFSSVSLSSVNARFMTGWDTDQAGTAVEGAIYFKGVGDIRTFLFAEVSIGSFSAATVYQTAVILRDDGLFMFVKGGAYTDWTLLWVDNANNTATVYPTVSYISGSAGTATIDYMRVAQLGSPFDSVSGFATDLIASPSAGNTFTHEADCVIEFTVDTMPSSGSLYVHFRFQDSNNYWTLRIISTGTIQLQEIVGGGAPVTRGAGAGGTTARYLIVANGETIKAYQDTTLLFTYATAANFKTETTGEVDSLGTGGAISNVISWPLNPSGAALVQLEDYSG